MKEKNGFKPVELFIAIVILAILCTIAIPKIVEAVENARLSEEVSIQSNYYVLTPIHTESMIDWNIREKVVTF